MRQRLGDDDLVFPLSARASMLNLFAFRAAENRHIPAHPPQVVKPRGLNVELEGDISEIEDLFVLRAEGHLDGVGRDAESLARVGGQQILQSMERFAVYG